jgi:hypothetical protein
VLGNCPFYILAQQRTELVCGMNLSLFKGLLEGLANTGLTGHLRPTHLTAVSVSSPLSPNEGPPADRPPRAQHVIPHAGLSPANGPRFSSRGTEST